MAADNRPIPAPAGPSTAARSIVLGILGAELALLAVTGVALAVLYRPAGVSSTVDALVALHRFTAKLTLSTAAVAAILLIAGPTPVLRAWRGRAHAAALPVLALAASVTGHLLPWRMLGLW